MAYVRARFEAEKETRLFREYVTESLRLQGEQKYLTVRWRDMVTPEKTDTRTGDEIAAEFILRAGLRSSEE